MTVNQRMTNFWDSSWDELKIITEGLDVPLPIKRLVQIFMYTLTGVGLCAIMFAYYMLSTAVWFLISGLEVTAGWIVYGLIWIFTGEFYMCYLSTVVGMFIGFFKERDPNDASDF